MKTLKWLSLASVSLVLLTVLVAGAWIVTESAMQATSGAAFCSVCHTMEPFVETHALDIHGGRNPKGLSAACADCHLPHDSPGAYLRAKASTGLRDIGAELIAMFREPDWISKLEQRESYVYDSGCLQCHTHLDQTGEQTALAAFAHQTYFDPQGAMQCVTCHTRVGHKNLLARLTSGGALPVVGAGVGPGVGPNVVTEPADSPQEPAP